MICKNADDKTAELLRLEALLDRADTEKRALIEREIRTLKAGLKGEKDSAYLIDFHLKKSANTAVIHDLRLKTRDGRIAQIDHLLIHRTYRFYLLETKHFAHGVKINEEGEFLRWNEWKKNYEGMPSPLEQNERHVKVLETILQEANLPPAYIQSFVLAGQQARIIRPKRFDTSRVVKADQFISAFEKDLSGMSFFSLVGGLFKNALVQPFEEVAAQLAKRHCPISFNYEARFGMSDWGRSAGSDTTQRQSDFQPGKPNRPHAVNEERQPYGSDTAQGVAQDSETGQASPAFKPSESSQCKSCQSTNLAIQYGKYNYYFKCLDCGGNTSINVVCSDSKHKPRLRKSGVHFYRDCEQCGISSLYFTNPATGKSA